MKKLNQIIYCKGAHVTVISQFLSAIFFSMDKAYHAPEQNNCKYRAIAAQVEKDLNKDKDQS